MIGYSVDFNPDEGFIFKTYQDGAWRDMSESAFSAVTNDLPSAFHELVEDFLTPSDEIPTPDYNPEDVAFDNGDEAAGFECEEHNYCLVTLKSGETVTSVTGDKFSSIVGDGMFDIQHWEDFHTLEFEGLSIRTDSVLAVMALDEEDFNNAKEYGHMLT